MVGESVVFCSTAVLYILFLNTNSLPLLKKTLACPGHTFLSVAFLSSVSC